MKMSTSNWERVSNDIEASREYHTRYHMAVTNPLRRRILQKISEGKGEDEIVGELDISREELNYHLKILEWGFCIVRTENNKWKLTKEGKVIEHL